mgnify:CR=1 FL=1
MPGNQITQALLGLYAAHGIAGRSKAANPISIAGLVRSSGVPRLRLLALQGIYRKDMATRPIKPEEADAIARETMRLGLVEIDEEALRAALLGSLSEEDEGPLLEQLEEAREAVAGEI